MSNSGSKVGPILRDPGEDVDAAYSLVNLLRIRASQQYHQVAYTFLVDGEKNDVHLSYGELDQQARAIAGKLQSLMLQGERAVLLYPQGLDYIVAFFGCLYAGVIAVPAYPPKNRRYQPKLQAIVNDCQASVILSTEAIYSSSRALSGIDKLDMAQVLLTDKLSFDNTNEWQQPMLAQDSLAFLQYTSGSTGSPKGVMVSHGNIMANQKAMQESAGHDAGSTFVGWLPFYHDMGLVCNIMQPLYIGAQAIFMSPMAFLEKPLRWLKAVSDYRAHTSGGPNFAYDLCVQKISETEKGQLDLSTWQLAFNGSEPINPETLDRFEEAFACCGFRREAFYPCYGLAESTIFVTGANKSLMPTVKAFDKTKLAAGQAEITTQMNDYRRLVSCGVPGVGHELRIINLKNGTYCNAGQVGEIQVSGSSVTLGYWQKPTKTSTTFVPGPESDRATTWLLTGDLGFIHEGELFVSGRLKDLIIVRGLNYYPHDIEIAAEAAVSCINPGNLAAFSVAGEDGEKLVLVAELKRSHLKQQDFSEEFAKIRKHLTEECDLQVDTIAFVLPGTILKTTSGKIRRNDCKDALERQQFNIIAIDELNCPARIDLQTADNAKLSSAPERTLLRQALLLMPPVEATRLLANYLSNKIQILSGLPQEQMDSFAPVLLMGIDSLKAMELKFFIDDLLAIDMPLALLLDNHSIMELAESALDLVALQDVQMETFIDDIKQSNQMVLSLGQQSIWTVCQLETNTIVYNLPVALQITAKFDTEIFRNALRILLDRHDQLRMGYALESGLPVQKLSPETGPVFTRFFCLDEVERTHKIVSEIYRPFNLEHDQKLRAALFSTSDDNHILLFSAHHIAVDFRSMVIILTELKAIYAAQVAGQKIDLPILTVNYNHYINWQQQYLVSNAAENALAYWQKQLAGELPKLQLPYDKKRSNAHSYYGDSEALAIDSIATHKLHQLAKQSGVTLYMLLLAIFKVLLYRYSGQQDIIVGSPIVGRPKKGFADLVGYFVSPVAIRTNPNGEKSFFDYLLETKQTVISALEHQDYPLSLLVEKLQPEREVGISPFYRVCFVLQGDAITSTDAAFLALGMPDKRIDWPGLNVKSISLPANIAQFDINLMMTVVGDELSASFQYSSELFERQTITRMVGHFQSLVRGILENPHCKLSALPLLTKPEYHQQVVEWNFTKVDYPEHVCLNQLFEQQVKRTPTAVAVTFEGQSLNYAELNCRANLLAHHLIALGIKPDDRVAICVERSLEMAIGLLGILKAGGAYVPLDSIYPDERLVYMLIDSAPAVLLTQTSLLENLSVNAKINIPVLLLNSATKNADVQSDNCKGYRITSILDWVGRPEQVADPEVANLTSQNLAYVIYTSGSTGNPKGVMNQHQGVVNRLLWAQHEYRLGSDDRVLQKTPFSFDVSVWEFFLPLLVGAELVIAKPKGHQDPGYLADLINTAQVTTIHFVPSMLQVFLENAGMEACQSLRRVLCSGEVLPYQLQKRFQQLLPASELHNLYGPTEAAIDVTAWRCNPDNNSGCVPIGQPIANIQIYILDTYFQPVPIGIAGELYIGGVGLARGYISRPELTAERFIPHPYSSIPGDRLYRTGDLARYSSNGVIEYLGRNDNQIKIRGFRIELGEIESRLLQHMSMKEAVVLIKEDQVGNKYLVAYLVSVADYQPDPTGIKTFLKKTLPDYMIPTAFIFLGALPLTANGKLDDKSLLALSGQNFQQHEYAAPRDEAEQAVAEIWQQILGVEQLGIYDNFFDLGGHSLSAVQIIAKIKENFAIDAPVKTLFEAPTIAEFVDRIAEFQEE